jgi:hypothetical protein
MITYVFFAKLDFEIMSFIEAKSLGAVMLILFLLGVCGIPFSYVFSFAFQSAASGQLIS